MFKRIILYLISYFMMVFGLSFILIYLNLITFEYTIYDFFYFIITRVECLLFFIGLFLFIFLVNKKKE